MKERSKEAYWKKFFIGSITVRLAQNPKNKAAESCRGQLTNGFCPNTETFSAVHNISVGCRSHPARSLGVLGGGAALSSLCRRFPGGDIMNLTSRRSPLSGLSFSEFFFLRERKTDRLRRSHKISVSKSKSPENPKQKKFSTPREPLQHRALPLCQQNCPDFSTDFST